MENFLKRLIIFSFLLIVIGINCFSQTHGSKLSGVVLDSETGQPIQYATVFLAFTAKGCLTDEKGEFIITNVAEGKYEVVCAAVGYEKITTNHTLKTGTEINVTYKLKPVPIQVNEINITASVPEDWEDNLLKFTKEFLGESSVARQCEIKNPEVIDFEIKDYQLLASSKQPVIVINKALGYKVTVYIKFFEWDSDYDEGKYAYEPFFEPLTSLDSTQIIRWNENRKAAYLGSFIHFLRSCASNTGFEEGFRLTVSENNNQALSIFKNIRNSSETTYIDWWEKERYDNSLIKIFKHFSNDVFVIESFDRIG
ncbi:MAG: carboxypeptidase-like regulatory domain-containing protein, partial [Ignavibacteria bacterium]|nr:carboxypeptidase-like regulatory domain-containing protein [Ignavibacteria bacterium]